MIKKIKKILDGCIVSNDAPVLILWLALLFVVCFVARGNLTVMFVYFPPIILLYFFIKSLKKEVEEYRYIEIKQALERGELSLETYKNSLIDSKLIVINFWYLKGMIFEQCNLNS